MKLLAWIVSSRGALAGEAARRVSRIRVHSPRRSVVRAPTAGLFSAIW